MTLNRKALTTVVALSAAFSLPAKADDITVVTWGGALRDAMVAAYDEVYKEKGFGSIKWGDYNGGLAEVRSQVESGNVVWDLVPGTQGSAIAGCEEGLLEPIDLGMLNPAPDGTPAANDFIAGAALECGAGAMTFALVQAYPCGIPTTPKSIADFFDLDKIPGKRGVPKKPQGTLEWALVADGVPTSDVYKVLSTPEGLDRAFAKLDTIKDEIIWVESSAHAPQLLADGEVTLTAALNGRIFSAVMQDGKDFCINWDAQYQSMDVWMVVKGTPRLKQALEFLKVATDPVHQAKLASLLPYGSTRISSGALIGNHPKYGVPMVEHTPVAPAHTKNVITTNPVFWADYQDELVRRFNTWIAQ